MSRDRSLKPGLYAEMGCPEYWILNLVDRVVEVHRHPRNGRYTEQHTVGAEGHLAMLALPDVSFAVADLLPPT